MSTLVAQLSIGIIGLLFGALITFFIKAVTEKKTIAQQITEVIHEQFKTHVRIYHSDDPLEAIEKEVSKCITTFDEKLLERDIKLDEVRRVHAEEMKDVKDDLKAVKTSVHNIELSVVKLTTYFEAMGELKK